MWGARHLVVVGSGIALVACTTDEMAAPEPSPPVEVASLVTPTDLPTGPPPGRVVQLDAEDARILREVEVGPDPLLAVGTSDAVWTLNLDDSTVSRIDADTGEVTGPATGETVGLASDGEDVWVATDGNHLARLDGSTGVAELEMTLADRELFGPRNAGWVVVGAGSVWVTVPPGDGGGGHELWRVDPNEDAVGSRIPIGGDPFPPVVASGAIWIADSDRELVVRVDLRTEQVSTRDVGPQPGAIAGGDGRVWVGTPGSIVELDPTNARELRATELPVAPRGLVWEGGRLWVATDVGVTVIDAESGEVEREIGLAEPSGDEGPISLVPHDGSVWVTIEIA